LWYTFIAQYPEVLSAANSTRMAPLSKSVVNLGDTEAAKAGYGLIQVP
jgi:hypothetical protein